MILLRARPIFVCGDCKTELTVRDLENDICSTCKIYLCDCICHIANLADCKECSEFHEGN
jgi:hypothetical protein